MKAPISFRPAADNLRVFRTALGQFATGVAIVTTVGEDGPTGMTINSFTSVSLSPPLVLWCLAQRSHRYEVFAKAQSFAINVLHSGQYELAMAFARDGEHFTPENSETGALGVPLLTAALACFECRLDRTVDAGDHSIVLGEVAEVRFREGDPLIFHGGHFGTFAG